MVLIFDLDDTLIDTSDLFWKVREEFLSLIANSEIPLDELRHLFENQDTKNIQKYGYQPDRYRRTMLDVYKHLEHTRKVSSSKEIKTHIENIGQKILDEIPELILGSMELLKKLKKEGHDLLLVTRGASITQNQKIEYHGLQSYFNEIFIVETKNAEVYRNIITSTGYNIEDAWIIGDSIKSDINPGLILGTNCIHFLYKHDHYEWLQEHDADPISENYYETSDISSVSKIIKRHAAKHNHDFPPHHISGTKDRFHLG